MSSKQHRQFSLAYKSIPATMKPEAVKLAKQDMTVREILDELKIAPIEKKVAIKPQEIQMQKEALINRSPKCEYKERGSYARCIYCNNTRFYMKNKECLAYKPEE